MDKDRNEAEIAECRQRMAQCNAQIAEHRMAIERLEEKIERLKSARDAVRIKKEEIGMTNGSLEGNNMALTHFMWCGSNREAYDREVIDVLKEGDAFKKDVDNLQDTLNDEITRLENERYEHEGIIGQLKMVLNNLSNWLANLLN